MQTFVKHLLHSKNDWIKEIYYSKRHTSWTCTFSLPQQALGGGAWCSLSSRADGVFQIHALYSALDKKLGFRATALGSVPAQHVPSLLLQDSLASGMDSAWSRPHLELSHWRPWSESSSFFSHRAAAVSSMGLEPLAGGREWWQESQWNEGRRCLCVCACMHSCVWIQMCMRYKRMHVHTYTHIYVYM